MRPRCSTFARSLCGALVIVASSPDASRAQAGPSRALDIGAVPALNFDSDEGFGYGAIAEVYGYASGLDGYAWTIQPTVFLTTRGRRDVTLFFDAPALLPSPWRLDAFAGSEKQIATPYYGLGNATVRLEHTGGTEDPAPYYYRFGRTRRSATANLQRTLGDPRIRALVGAGVVRVSIDPVPEGSERTLFAIDHGGAPSSEWANHVRAGLIWDTRDRETGPGRGTWTELLVQRVDRAFGSDASFTRVTFTDRRYLTLREGLVFAHRYLVQNVGADAPAHELHRVQTSFKQQEGLGGSKTVRGVSRNRFVGRGLLVWNAELRWRAVDFEVAGRSLHATVTGFVDQGRVWERGVRIAELFDDLHRGYGGGLRLGMGENFVVAVDAGTSRETGLQVYVGLGYLY